MRKLLFALPLLMTACGDTNTPGRLVIQSAYGTVPTCATATADGDLCVADAIEANGALDVAGVSTLTGAVSSGALTSTGAVAGATLAATTTITSTSSQYVLAQANLGATCTVGELKVDTETTAELCYCQATDTWYCISFTTATGPTD